MRETLEPHELRHAHGTEVADTADVVAAEVDQHHVLGALLLVALQLLRQPQILLVGLAAAAGAGNRMRLDARAFHTHQHLRRGANERDAVHADEIHVGRRVHVAQRAVDRERVGAHLGLEALRQHHLVDVAGGDVLLRCAHLCLEMFTREVRGELQLVAVRLLRHRQVALEFALEEPDLRHRELVERLEIVVGSDARVRDDQDAVLHVVERQHGVEQHEPRIVGTVNPLAQVAEHRFEPGGRPVAEVANRPAGEARQLGHERRLVVRHQRPQRVDERRLAVRHLAGPLDRRRAAGRAQDQERVLAEERVAADVLAPFHALEQERVVRIFRDLQERRHRREQVGHDLLADRDERAAQGQFRELLKRGDFHLR